MGGEADFLVELGGETALVTGGTRNIGLAVAEALARAGASVCVVGLSDAGAVESAVSRLEALGARAMGLLRDVSDEAAVTDAYERIASELGPVSVLVNGAARRPHEPLTGISKRAWSDVVDVILTGAFLTSRELFRRLPEGRNGAIVNLGGLSAHRPSRDRAHVIAAKSGLIGLTRALAEEGLGRIRANAVVPGDIETERRPGEPRPKLRADEESLRGTTRDVARAVLGFSDPRDVYVTGQTLHVSGGRYMP